MRPDRFSPPLERPTDLSAFRRTRVIEREGRERRKKRVELRVFTTGIGTRLSAVAQFGHDYGPGGARPRFPQQAGYGSLRHREAQLARFAVNPRGAPRRTGGGHLADEGANG